MATGYQTRYTALLNVLVLVGFLALMPVAFATVSCRSIPASASAVQISMRLVTEKKVGPAVVEAAVRGVDGQPLGGAKVTLRGDMNHAGMAPIMVQMREVSAGDYLADEFKFTMAGDWLLTIEVVPAKGEKVERTFSVAGVEGG